MGSERKNRDYQGGLSTSRVVLGEFMMKVYGWFSLMLLITICIAGFTSNSSFKYLAKSVTDSMFLILGELILVLFLSANALKMKNRSLQAAFLIFSGLNGITLSTVFFKYQLESISLVFLISTVFFGFISIYSVVTRQRVSKWGSKLLLCLIGMAVAILINIFSQSNIFSLIISYFAVAIFLALTVYNSTRIINLYQLHSGTENEKNISVLGALILSIDFIILFLCILKILGT